MTDYLEEEVPSLQESGRGPVMEALARRLDAIGEAIDAFKGDDCEYKQIVVGDPRWSPSLSKVYWLISAHQELIDHYCEKYEDGDLDDDEYQEGQEGEAEGEVLQDRDDPYDTAATVSALARCVVDITRANTEYVRELHRRLTEPPFLVGTYNNPDQKREVLDNLRKLRDGNLEVMNNLT